MTTLVKEAKGTYTHEGRVRKGAKKKFCTQSRVIEFRIQVRYAFAKEEKDRKWYRNLKVTPSSKGGLETASTSAKLSCNIVITCGKVLSLYWVYLLFTMYNYTQSSPYTCKYMSLSSLFLSFSLHDFM